MRRKKPYLKLKERAIFAKGVLSQWIAANEEIYGVLRLQAPNEREQSPKRRRKSDVHKGSSFARVDKICPKNTMSPDFSRNAFESSLRNRRFDARV